MQTSPHEKWIRHCLSLASQACGMVGSGVMVGSALVRNDKLLAENFHRGFGDPHAEHALLTAYTQEITPRDVLYVNLEPCVPNPTKKTPGCSTILIERGVQQVVYAMTDPDPRVAGKGILTLRNHGIDVIGPICESAAQDFNRGYIHLRTRGIPWCNFVASALDLENAPQFGAWHLIDRGRTVPAVLLHQSELSSFVELIESHPSALPGPSHPVSPMVIVAVTHHDPDLCSLFARLSSWTRLFIACRHGIIPAIPDKELSCVLSNDNALPFSSSGDIRAMLVLIGSPSTRHNEQSNFVKPRYTGVTEFAVLATSPLTNPLKTFLGSDEGSTHQL